MGDGPEQILFALKSMLSTFLLVRQGLEGHELLSSSYGRHHPHQCSRLYVLLRSSSWETPRPVVVALLYVDSAHEHD